ncbi:MAG: RNA polymerase sigma factor [Thermomicrobiales bacterium]
MTEETTIDRYTGAQPERRTAMLLAGGFEGIYDEYHGRIFGLAYRMMGSVDEALDVTQDAFISAYLNLDKLTPKRCPDGPSDIHLSAWLHRIAANKCIDALRKRRRQVFIDWDVYESTASSPAEAGQPEVHALGQERTEEVQRVLNRMTPNYRLVLLLQEYQEMSIREIAQTVDRSESAVKSMLFRAREQFRSLYELDEALARVA